MHPVRIPSPFLPTFKHICNQFGAEIRPGAVPLLGNKLYDAISRALHHKNYSALMHDANAYGNGSIDLAEVERVLLTNLPQQYKSESIEAVQWAIGKAIAVATTDYQLIPVPEEVLRTVRDDCFVIVGGQTAAGTTTFLKEVCRADAHIAVVSRLLAEWENHSSAYNGYYECEPEILERSSPHRIVIDCSKTPYLPALSDEVKLAQMGFRVITTVHEGNLSSLASSVLTTQATLENVGKLLVIRRNSIKGRTELTYSLLRIDVNVREKLWLAISGNSEGMTVEDIVDDHSLIFVANKNGSTRFDSQSYREYLIADLLSKGNDQLSMVYLKALAIFGNSFRWKGTINFDVVAPIRNAFDVYYCGANSDKFWLRVINLLSEIAKDHLRQMESAYRASTPDVGPDNIVIFKAGKPIGHSYNFDLSRENFNLTENIETNTDELCGSVAISKTGDLFMLVKDDSDRDAWGHKWVLTSLMQEMQQ